MESFPNWLLQIIRYYATFHKNEIMELKVYRWNFHHSVALESRKTEFHKDSQ